MAADLKALDPRGLIAEAYRMDGIAGPECRSIFLDWALADAPQDSAQAVAALLGHYQAANPEHPMTEVLKEGLDPGVRRVARRGRRL